MKNTKSFLLVLLSAAILFAGCKASLLEKDSGNKGPMATVTFNLQSGTQSARTAVPGTINWGDYFYTLTVSDGKTSTEPLTNETYANLAAAKLTLALGVYTFTLDAYSGSVKVLSGTINNLDISGGAVSLTFVMKQEPGLESAVSVKLWLPSYNGSSIVKKVMAGVSNSPVATIGECTLKGATELIISGDKTATPSVTFGANDLQTGKRQYVMFYLYDENEDLIGTITEGVVLLYGKTSSSEIEVDQYTLNTYPVEIKLRKNGGLWEDARKVKLLGKVDNVEYLLTSYGKGTEDDPYVYTGSLANSAYYVLVQSGDSNLYKNTNISIDTAKSNVITLDYYTVTLNPGTGVVLQSVSEVTPQADGTILFLSGDEYTYKAILKDGYNPSSAVTIKENNTNVSLNLNTAKTIKISRETTISTTNATAIPYSITYNVTEVQVGGSSSTPMWRNGKVATVGGNAPAELKTYTVTNDFNLPTAADITCAGMIIDGWYIEGQSEDDAFATIKADTLHENLTLKPKWKDMSASSGESTEGEDSEGSLSSNGISFIIKDGGTANGDVVTHIYYDLNSNGVVDPGDTQVVIGGNSNFTDYEITASTLTGADSIKSNVTFTVTGGRIYSIKGLGKDAANTSVLKISGTAVIGDATQKMVEINNIGYTFGTSVHGVDLSSFTNERIYVDAKLNSPQNSIVAITDYNFDVEVPHYIAQLDNETFAEAGQFVCFNSNVTANGMQKKTLGMLPTKEGLNVIRLINESGISLENNDETIELIYDGDTDVVIGFSVGDDKINTECSVLSISTPNGGAFKFNQTKMYPNDSAKESGLNYLGQYKAGTNVKQYDEFLDANSQYVYMHIMAKSTMFTEGQASDFLKNVTFVPDKNADGTFKEMTVRINLEQVPASEINAMKAQALANAGKEDAFSYFDGSFYLGVKDASKPRWSTAYNNAKKTKFNGLTGYLMTIENQLENDYITNRMKVGNSWIGGARIEPGSGYDPTFTAYDQAEINSLQDQTYVTKYYWVCGPSAGVWFTDGNIPSGSTGKGLYGKTKSTAAQKLIYNGQGDNKIFTNWDSKEPNDSLSQSGRYYSEQCVHFYSDSGKWNDFGDSYKDPIVYMIEFTPYTRYDINGNVLSTSGTQGKPSIKKTAVFDLNTY